MKDKIILLVEDDPAHAELIKIGLFDRGFAGQFVHIADGRAALEYLRRQGAYAEVTEGLPDLILLDLRLPSINGLEVLKEIKSDEMLMLIPTIILTTSCVEEELREAYRRKANGYLVKPAGFDEFSYMLGATQEYWLKHNHTLKMFE